MTAQPVETFLNDKFLNQALKTLKEDGFITDEHSFAPYRETINVHVGAIQRALRERCSGQLTPDTGLSFFSATAGASPSLN